MQVAASPIYFLSLLFFAVAVFERWKRSSTLSDHDLIEKYAQTHDNQYFAELFKRYTHLVYGICMKYLKDSDSSKDAVMVVFEKLLEDLKTRKVDNFGHWIHIVAKNHCLMQLRKGNLETSFPENNLPEIVENEEEKHHIEDTENNIQRLENGMQLLAIEQRSCVELFYLQEKSYQEVAYLTGYSLNQVKSYIQNGKRNLYIYMTTKNGQ